MNTADSERWTWRDFAPIGRLAVVAVVTIVLCIFLYGSPSGSRPAVARDAPVRIPLATKDRDFHVVPPSRGGAAGSVWYRPEGRSLPIQLRVAGLVPRLHYRLDLYVDTTLYPVANLRADDRGTVAFDTTLTELAANPCVRPDTTRRRPLAGTMSIKFWIQRDGSPAGDSTCAGNGDGDFSYALFEENLATFSARQDSAP